MKKRRYLSIIIAQIVIIVCLLLTPDVRAALPSANCPSCPTFGCMCMGDGCYCWAAGCECGCVYPGPDGCSWGGRCAF